MNRSKNYVEWRAYSIKTRHGEMIKWQNGETVLLKVRAKVVRYNPSNKIIERINKRTQQSSFLFQFVLVTGLLYFVKWYFAKRNETK